MGAIGQPHGEVSSKHVVLWVAVKTIFVGGGQRLRHNLLECQWKVMILSTRVSCFRCINHLVPCAG